MDGQELPDRGFQIVGAAKDAAAQPFGGEFRKPAFDQVDPRGARRGEVHVIAQPLEQPTTNRRGLMGAVIIEDEMDLQCGGHRRVDGVQEPPKFDRPMAPMALPDDPARLHVEGGEQRGRPGPPIIVAAPFYLARPQGQQRLRAVERLDLGFLIDTEHQGPIGRVQIQADNIADLLNKQRVLGELERLRAMRLQRKRAPDPTDGALRQATGGGHGPGTPVRRLPRRRLQGSHQDPLHIGIGEAARRPGAGLIQEPVDPLGHKARPPFAHGRFAHPQRGRHRGIGVALRAGQDQSSTLRQRLGRLRPAAPAFQQLIYNLGH